MSDHCWEYKIVGVELRVGEIHTHYMTKLLETYNKYGSEGWELVSVYHNTAYFKRPKDWEYMNKVDYRGLGEVPL